MLFNDDSMLDFRGNGFGDDVMDAAFGRPMGFDAGEVVITGRVPGALYVDDFSEAQYGLEHIQPLEFTQNELSSSVTVDLAQLANDSGPDTDPVVPVDGESGAALVAANDDAPAALPASHGKDAEPLVLVGGDDFGPLDDPFDLAIPDLPLFSAAEAPAVTLATSQGEDAAPIFFETPYQSLSFLIIDTPFAVGDDHLPLTLRPPLNDLLGLGDDDGQTWVLPLGDKGAWLLG